MDNALGLRMVGFALAGLVLYLPLFGLLPSSLFRSSRRTVVMGASLFWFAFTAILVQVAWSYYYRFFYPSWMHWGTALVAAALYSIYALGCHWLSCHLPGRPMLWYCLFTGLLAAGEHYIAWNFAHVPEKVPLLAGMPLVPTMIFAFFEYQVYWAVALWLAWILINLSSLRKHEHEHHFHPRWIWRHRQTTHETSAR